MSEFTGNSVQINGENAYNREWKCIDCDCTEKLKRKKCETCDTIYDEDRCPQCSTPAYVDIEICALCDTEVE